MSNRLRMLISHHLTTQLTASTSVKQGLNCMADGKHKSLKALVKIFYPQSYSVTFLNGDLLSMAFLILSLILDLVASGGNPLFIPLSERITSVSPNHRVKDHSTVHLNHTPTHIPDQLLSYLGHHEEPVALRHSLSCYKRSPYCHVFYHFMATSTGSLSEYVQFL